jgi:hypothetical protein
MANNHSRAVTKLTPGTRHAEHIGYRGTWTVHLAARGNVSSNTAEFTGSGFRVKPVPAPSGLFGVIGMAVVAAILGSTVYYALRYLL